MMKLKLINNKVTDEREEEAQINKVGAVNVLYNDCRDACVLVYSSFFNNGVITSNYLAFPLLIAWIWSVIDLNDLVLTHLGFWNDSLRLFTGDWAYHPYDNVS